MKPGSALPDKTLSELRASTQKSARGGKKGSIVFVARSKYRRATGVRKYICVYVWIYVYASFIRVNKGSADETSKRESVIVKA